MSENNNSNNQQGATGSSETITGRGNVTKTQHFPFKQKDNTGEEENDNGEGATGYTGYTGGGDGGGNTGATGHTGSGEGATGYTGYTGQTGSNEGVTGTTGAGNATGATGTSQPTGYTGYAPNDEAVIKFLNEKGIKVSDLNSLKEKVDYTPPAPEPTAEEKKKIEAQTEKNMLDLFVSDGQHTIEEFASLKTLANADPAQVSEAELRKELKAEKFTDDEINDIISEGFFEVSDEEIEKYENETERNFLKRKKEVFAKRKANYAAHIVTEAKEILEGLKNAVISRNVQAQKEKDFVSKVEAHFSNMSRSLTIEVGKINDVDTDPIQYPIDDNHIKEVKELLQDPVKRQQYFFNNDNTLNLEKIADVMIRNMSLESIVKTTYLEGGTRQVEEFKKTFPAHSAHAIGTGGAPKGGDKNSKTISGRGKVQRVA